MSMLANLMERQAAGKGTSQAMLWRGEGTLQLLVATPGLAGLRGLKSRYISVPDMRVEIRGTSDFPILL